jgi:hypothetical protein
VPQAILVHIPCVSCSYYVQLQVLSKYANVKLVPVLMSPTRVNISEIVFFFNAFKYHHELDGVVWVDTKFNVRIASDEFPHAKIYTTSRWNAELLPRVDGILPRVVDVELAREFWGEKKKYDFVVIASTDKEVDHKHVLLSHELLKRLGVRERSVIVSNVDVADYPVFSLSEEEKYRLLAQSYFYLALSGSEGFGLPPVEAMSVGTIPVYLNAHAYKEWLRGIPVRVSETREVTVSKLPMVLHVPDEEDALEKMKYALSIRHEKEYKEMSEEVKKYAVETFHPVKLTRTIPYFSR